MDAGAVLDELPADFQIVLEVALPVSVFALVGTSSTTVDLVWYGVTAPSGTPVEYEVQLASDPGFTRPLECATGNLQVIHRVFDSYSPGEWRRLEACVNRLPSPAPGSGYTSSA